MTFFSIPLKVGVIVDMHVDDEEDVSMETLMERSLASQFLNTDSERNVCKSERQQMQTEVLWRRQALSDGFEEMSIEL